MCFGFSYLIAPNILHTQINLSFKIHNSKFGEDINYNIIFLIKEICPKW